MREQGLTVGERGAASRAEDDGFPHQVVSTAEHAPESLKAGSKADFVTALSSVKTKSGKAFSSTSALAPWAEVAAGEGPRVSR